MNNTKMRQYLIRAAAIAVILAVSVVMLASCGTSTGGAEAKATEDLEAMRYVELDPEAEAEIQASMSDRGREYFEMFLGKAGEFDYEITGAEANGDEAIVNVRITTYDFASEYLRTWTEFLEASGGDGSGSEAQYDTALLNETLFRNLSSIQEKGYKSDVSIICTRDEEGDWTTDAATNSTLKNAIFGGMLGEISSLAGL